MIKLLWCLAALLALLLAGFAPTAPAQSPPPATEQPARPALWKVTGPHSTIYLFGTIHLLPAGIDWFDGPIASAFGQSNTLVTEILEPTPEDMRSIIAAKALLKSGQSLRTMLAPTARMRLEAALAANHLPASGLDRYQPWYAAVALATAPMSQMGYDPDNGVDRQLAQRAQAQGLPQEALETAEYQLGLFASLPQPEQQAYLMHVIKELPKARSELTGIIQAWQTGDVKVLARLMNADGDDPQLMETLLIDRNRQWSKWIRTRLAKPAKPQETVFIAVGAGHLAGSGSVIDQLRSLGIATQRVQ